MEKRAFFALHTDKAPARDALDDYRREREWQPEEAIAAQGAQQSSVPKAASVYADNAHPPANTYKFEICILKKIYLYWQNCIREKPAHADRKFYLLRLP